MSISILKLLIDFGLLILIWIIQVIIYPSFLHYNTENLIVWHRKYTPLISCIAGPLMLAQLGLSIYQMSIAINFYHGINLLMISTIWIITFLQFIPIHNNISKGRINEKMILSLVKKKFVPNNILDADIYDKFYCFCESIKLIYKTYFLLK